jgi:hypothetical protein
MQRCKQNGKQQLKQRRDEAPMWTGLEDLARWKKIHSLLSSSILRYANAENVQGHRLQEKSAMSSLENACKDVRSSLNGERRLIAWQGLKFGNFKAYRRLINVVVRL